MKFVIAGCGSIGKRHLNNLQRLGQTDLVAMDVRADRRAEAAERFGVTVSDDFADALKSGPQGVLICTPTSLHTEYALQAVRAGAHVFIEKPIAQVLTGLDELLDAAETNGCRILVGCNFRFERGLRWVRTMLDTGTIGRVLGARVVFGQYLPEWHPWEDYRHGYSARRALGGGIILDAVHEVDYIRWLLGEVQSVACFASKVSDLEIDVEDHADMLLRFTTGVTAQVHVDYLQRAYQRALEIYGAEGTLVWSFQDRLVRCYSAKTKAWQTLSWMQDPSHTVDEMYLAEMQHFIECVRGTEQPTLDGRGGRRVLQIALAAKESAEANRVIELL